MFLLALWWPLILQDVAPNYLIFPDAGDEKARSGSSLKRRRSASGGDREATMVLRWFRWMIKWIAECVEPPTERWPDQPDIDWDDDDDKTAE